MDQLIKATPQITPEERAARQHSIDTARGSVRLEGFVVSDEAEAIAKRHVDGELTAAEMTAEIKKLYGL